MHDGHTHIHTANHGGADNISAKDELVALLKYMIGHNRSHTEELDKIIGKLGELGDASAVNYVKSAVDFYSNGNDALAKALAELN